MNNYLLQLLKEVKTIIIPGLGALTLTNEATGEMMFMNYLKFDDGTLAKHIAEKEGIDENDAKNRIAKFVREVIAELDKGTSYDMYQFGSFKKVDGETVFEQWSGAAASALPAEPVAEKGPEIVPEEPKQEEAQPEIESVPEVVEPEVIPEQAKEEEKTFDAETTIETSAIAAAVVTEDAPEIREPEVELTDEGFDTEHSAPVIEEKPVEVHQTNQPINDIPEEVKHEPNVAPSPKDVLIAKDARNNSKEIQQVKDPQNKVKAPKEEKKPKRKMSVFAYILWGIIVLFLGGATYVAINFNTLKESYPILADLSGDNKTTATKTEPIVSTDDTVDQREAAEETTPSEEPEVAPEPAPEPPVMPEPAPSVSKPKPVTSAHTVSRTKPVKNTSSSSSVVIGQPDPSKPFHIIGGSFASEANAKSFARKMISEGLPSVIVGESGGKYRVSLASYASKAEAVSAHGNLVGQYPGAWVFKWP